VRPREIWSEIGGYGGIYEISNLGRVKSFHRNWRKGKILKQGLQKTGILSVGLSMFAIAETHIVSRLVAKAFMPNPHNLPCVLHISGKLSDNCIDNLMWGDYTDEYINNIKNGMIELPEHRTTEWNRKKSRGAKHWKTSIGENDVKNILKDAGTCSNIEIGKKYGVTDHVIGKILNNKTWKHVAGVRTIKPKSKITLEMRQNITNEYSQRNIKKATLRSIGKKYKLSGSTVYRIIKGTL